MSRLKEILLESDITLAAFMLGIGLIAWGLVAVMMSPVDLFFFADVAKSTTWLFWLWNYEAVGAGFIWLSYKRFPPMPSLLIGAYAIIMWTWIATLRSTANLTAGLVLNFIVIIMGCILLQRSNVK